MKTPKVHILFKFQLGPWGGGNQFLKALKNYFIQEGVYEEDPIKADCILVNSHHNLKDVLRMKYTYPRKIVIHRIDGPVSKIRGTDYKTDKIIYKFNKLIADATVFQSNWSQEENYKLGMKKNSNNTVIINAPDPKIFNRENRIKFERNRKTRVIATSWSANWRKGFDIYQYFDGMRI